jgi:hypothetical protein
MGSFVPVVFQSFHCPYLKWYNFKKLQISISYNKKSNILSFNGIHQGMSEMWIPLELQHSGSHQSEFNNQIWTPFRKNRIGGVMISVLALSAVGRGFEPRSGQTKVY